jgi:RHS repeat-associated protein
MLDGGNLPLQYNRNRHYDQYTGRWFTHDPLGIVPNVQKLNRLDPLGQYTDGMSLYEYAGSNPVLYVDPDGRFMIYVYDYIIKKLGEMVVDALAQEFWESGLLSKTTEENIKPDAPCQPGMYLSPKYKIDRKVFFAVRTREYRWFSNRKKYKDFYLFKKLMAYRHIATIWDCICACTGGSEWQIIVKDHMSTENQNTFTTISTGGSVFGNEFLYSESDVQVKQWLTEDYYEWGCGPERGLEPMVFFIF